MLWYNRVIVATALLAGCSARDKPPAILYQEQLEECRAYLDAGLEAIRTLNAHIDADDRTGACEAAVTAQHYNDLAEQVCPPAVNAYGFIRQTLQFAESRITEYCR